MSRDFTPFPYQVPMRQWLREREISALFVSPGMGKTVVTLDWIDWLLTTGRSKGALIIAPLRPALVTWPDQHKLWSHSSWMKFADLRTPEGQQAWFDGSAHVYVGNYEMLSTREVTLRCKVCEATGEIRSPDGLEEPSPCHACMGVDKKTKETRPLGYTTRKDYGLIHKLVKKLHRRKKPLPVDTWVADELSIAKNHNSKRINALRAYNDYFKYRLGLTGTPIAGSYMNLFAQIRLLDDGKRLGRTFEDFKHKYFEREDYSDYKWKLRPGAKEEIDRKIADMCLVMLSSEYMDLPTTTTEDIMVPLPSEAMKLYKTLQKKMLVQLETGEVTALSAAVLCTKLLQMAGGASYDDDKNVHFVHNAKIEALKKLRKKHGKEPILVFTAYKHEMARVLEAIPGSRKFDERDLGEWQKGRIHTWVANPRSLSHGLDGLQVAGRIAIWYTLPYSDETYGQSNARLIRTGQEHETIIYRLMVPKSIDEAVAEVLRAKEDEEISCLHALRALQQLNS